VESLRAQVEAESALDALQEITRRAEHDPLTQLPNRVLLLDRFSRAIASAERHGGRLALLFLDLDGFKQINDTLGHATGDEVLKLVAQRLSSAVRKADTVSRHGGDEFLILLTEVSQASDARLIAEKVRAALKAPARVGPHRFDLSASIGISLYPDDGLDADQLIEQADTAMYEAKRRNDGGVQAARPATDRAAFTTPRVPSRLDLLLADSERRNERLVEENRRLAAALEKVQEQLAAAEQTRRREIEFMVVLAHDLCMPLASAHATAAELERIGAEQPLLGQVQDNLDKHRVDVSALMHEAIEACGPAMAARHQHLSVRLPQRRPVVLGDPVRLAQALCNLLENASKYTQMGGRICLSAITGEDRVELTVSDNGRGIDPRLLPGIFEPFVRGSNDSGPDGAGLGLGLTLVRQFIEAHGGQVAAKSGGEGMGSDFVVTLPLVDSTAGAPPIPEA
jgi:diguanylate cyclase